MRLTSEIEAELAAAAKNWSRVWGEFETKIGTLHARLVSGWEMSDEGRDGGAPPTVEDHFLALLATGAMDEAMEQFLSTSFNRRGASHGQSLDAAATAVHATLLNRVTPAAEAAVLRLSELGSGAMEGAVGPVGLSEAAAAAPPPRRERV